MIRKFSIEFLFSIRYIHSFVFEACQASRVTSFSTDTELKFDEISTEKCSGNAPRSLLKLRGVSPRVSFNDRQIFASDRSNNLAHAAVLQLHNLLPPRFLSPLLL